MTLLLALAIAGAVCLVGWCLCRAAARDPKRRALADATRTLTKPGRHLRLVERK